MAAITENTCRAVLRNFALSLDKYQQNNGTHSDEIILKNPKDLIKYKRLVIKPVHHYGCSNIGHTGAGTMVHADRRQCVLIGEDELEVQNRLLKWN